MNPPAANPQALEEQIKKAILDLANPFPQGFSQEQLMERINRQFSQPPTLEQVVTVLSAMSTDGRVLSFVGPNGKPRWQIQSEERFLKLRGLNSVDVIVYTAIESSGNQGLWIKDLRKRINIAQSIDLERSLRILMQRKLIKLEDSIAGRNKKVYMLYELSPAPEISGSVWHSQTTKTIDTRFVKDVQDLIMRILHVNGAMTPAYICRMIAQHNIVNTPLTSSDIYIACQSLLYDRKIQRGHVLDISNDALRTEYIHTYTSSSSSNDGGNNDHDSGDPIYRIVPADIESCDVNAFASPCTSCPLILQCGPGQVIEPESCEYITTMLQRQTHTEFESYDWAAKTSDMMTQIYQKQTEAALIKK